MAADGAERHGPGAGGSSGRSRVAVAAAIGGGVALVALVALAALWIERAPIVAHFVDDELARRHVAGRYRIAAIGPFAQRLEDVSIGDPARPDLTARVVEVRLGYGTGGPHVVAVRADGVRLAARVADGRVSLGALDRLLPASSGTGPVALPAIDLTLADAQVRLASPAGIVTADVAGTGMLAGGFHGEVIARSPRLVSAGCAIERPVARIALRVADRRPRIAGPLDMAGIACADGVAAGPGRARVALRFARSLDRWDGAVALAGFAGRVPGARFGVLGGTVTIAGDTRRGEGEVGLTAAEIAARGATARRLRADGRWRYAAASGLVYAGAVRADGAVADAAIGRRIVAGARGAAATPLGPVADRIARSAAAALARADLAATIAFTAGGPEGTALKLRRLVATAATGATARIDEGAGFGWSVREGGWRADGRVAIAGGGLPTLDAVLTQPRAGAAVSGTIRMTPYAVGGSRLALAPVTVTEAAGATRFATAATIAGPLAGGRIDGLALPITGSVARGTIVFGARCAPVGVDRLALSGAVIERARLTACGIDGAPILRVAGGRVAAGVQVDALRLRGRTGSAPLDLAAGQVRVSADGLAARDVAVRIGAGEAVTRLDVATLDGRFGAATGGGFAGAGGQIGRVPLLLGDAAGRWSLAGGTLTLDGALGVSDAAAQPRFRPMRGEAVRLTLKDGRIAATGTLHEPRTRATIADVAIAHDLATGTGDARLTVPGIAFDKALQPDMLTPVTLGVVANVAGTVAGEGRIDWSPAGTTSTGRFHTDRIDLAAALGPVTGIAGTIRFSDLLGLVTPPGQEATVAEINPGVAVTAGVVHYQLLPAQRIRVEDARWPFAGGALTLDPTTLEFGADSTRHLTFRIRALNAAAFVQELAFPNLAATGTFDGVLPMAFDQKGGRIAGGAIVARPPGGTLAYLGELSRERVGLMGTLAFDALKAIRYRSLSIELDGRLDGEIVSRVRFEGVRQATVESGIVGRLIRNLPFRFNIAIRAPFRSLIGTARSYVDPSLLLTAQSPGQPAIEPPAIHPPESEPVR